MKSALYPLSASETLLLACASHREAPQNERRLMACLSAPDIDWPEFVRLSIQHGLAATAAVRLDSLAENAGIPGAVRVCLNRIYRETARRNAVMFRETGPVVRALEQAGIRCIVLKGVGLALTVYADPALRGFADVDLLVDQANYVAAGEILRGCGFAPEEREIIPADYHFPCIGRVDEDILSGTLAPEFDPRHAAEAVRKVRHRLLFEVHRSLFYDVVGKPKAVEETLYWEKTETAVLPDGTPIRLLAPDVLLAHLAAHAASHAYYRLLFPFDIALALQTYGARLDGNRLRAVAAHCEALPALCRLLDFAERELGAPLPDTLWKPLCAPTGQTKNYETLSPQTIFQIMRRSVEEPSANTWQRVQNSGDWRERLSLMARLLFPAPATMRRLYGVQSPFLLAAFYAVRPFQLLGRLARVQWRSLSARRRRVKSSSPAGG